MKLSEGKINSAAVEAGEWIDNLPDCDDLRIRTRGVTCAAYKRLLQARVRALPRKAKINDVVDPVVFEELGAVCVIEACAMDWENMFDADGTAMPFSKEMALALIADPDNQFLKQAFVVAAGRVGQQRKEDQDQSVGNSPAA